MPAGSVSTKERAVTWGSSIAIGVAMYFLFVGVLTAGPADEAARVRGRISALATASLAPPKKLPPGETKAVLAETRATASYASHLERQLSDLKREVRLKRFWAIAIGLVAGVGCFALCAVAYARRATGSALA